MMNLQSKVALITGASSGIGAAAAKLLAAEGVKVGLAARRADRLKELRENILSSGGEAFSIEMDVTDPDSVQRGADLLSSTYGTIDILINNAGIMYLSEVESLRIDEWHQMIDVNIKGVLNATAAVLPLMIGQHSGHIVNISSYAGRKLAKGLSVYSATKFAVTAFTEGLRMELGPKHNIRTTVIEPGAVKTELFDLIRDEQFKEEILKARAGVSFMSPEQLASTILFALKAPESVNIASLFAVPVDEAW
jgi:NADP-dependent 3-hydroxy acid dehydrogenase YdfG